MFSQKLQCWSDYNNNNQLFQQNLHGSEANYLYPTCATITTNGNSPIVGSTCSTSRSFENSPDYFKDLLDKFSDKEKYILGLEKQIAGAVNQRALSNPVVDSKENVFDCQYDTQIECDNNEENNASPCGEKFSDLKKSSILSCFYKADGTPVRGLWDSEASARERKSFKYDPKPLERRKNPRSFVPDGKKTEEYWERRRKNNMAARKSREDRRKKEIEILKVVESLKIDNLKLKLCAEKVMIENQNLKYQLDVLKRL